MDVQYIPLRHKLTTCPPVLREHIQYIDEMDFSAQKQKFVTDPEVGDWTFDQVDAAEILYKNFLYLRLVHPQYERLAPSRDIDEFWHGHILDTRRYGPDCDAIFGHLLHHNPYFGYGSTKAVRELVDTFDLTQQLHTTEFGAPIVEVRSYGD